MIVPPPRPELTVRAVATGMLFGALLTPCNVYSGLKIGWAFNMSIAAGLLGFGLWRLGELTAGARPWGLYENNISQTAASAAASIISGGLVAPVPAWTLLTGETLPWPLLAVWVFAVSMLGIVVAAGLRNQMLLHEGLRFPAGVATAETLRQIHAHGAEALGRLRLLLAAGGISAGMKLTDSLAFALPRPVVPLGLSSAGATAGNLGFLLDPSLLMVGFGAIIGLRVGLSLLFGALFAWGFLGPLALSQGWAARGAPAPDASWFGPLVEWLLWPGVTLMVVAALVAFAVSLLRVYRRRRSRPSPPAPPILPRRALLAGFAGTLLLATAAQTGLFGIGLWEAVLAVLLSFVLAIVAARVSGETGITPIGAMGKITQLTYGLVTPGDVTANLMSANVTGGAAGQCADLMHDLRTGQIVGATPGFQIVAQGFGVLTGSLIGSLIYLVLIPDPHAMLLTPDWPAPAVATWKAVAEVLSQGIGAIPAGAVPAMGIAAALGIALAVAERMLPARAARWLPSAPAVGLAFVIPAWNALSMFLGALLGAALRRLAPRWAERHTTVLAAGLVAGESIAGVAVAAARLAGAP